MGTPFREVYETFLGRVDQDEWALLEDIGIMEKDWKQLLKMAINRFMFPRISLEYVEVKEQEEEIVEPPVEESLEEIEPSEEIEDEAIEEEELIEEAEEITEDSFVEQLGQQEIQLLAVFMKNEWIKRALASWKLMQQQYHTKDFQFLSQANHMDRLREVVNQSNAECLNMTNLYSRVINHKPFNWGRLAGRQGGKGNG